MTRGKIIDPIPLISFAFVFFVRLENTQAESIRNQLLSGFKNCGMDIRMDNPPIVIANPAVQGRMEWAIQQAGNEAYKITKVAPQIIVTVLDGQKGLYEQVKVFTLVHKAVLTQCLQFKHFRKGEVKDQYASNVALKINIKLGGATNHVDRLPLVSNVRTLLLGADVTHSHAGSSAPSVAAVVSSVDRAATKYATYLRAQQSRVEIIQDLKAIVLEALKTFAKANNNNFPDQVIFFRDGVSSGQFKAVREQEVRDCLEAMREMGCRAKLSFLVVQKRHHLRLFPTDGNQDNSGNCLPGTTVDTTVVHPVEYNFILQSHKGMQGTSRPTLYHVLYDDIKMPSDELQQLCFNLCFLAERATKSISMVAPAYRAHIAAYYGRMFLDGEWSSDASSLSTSKAAELPVTLMPVAQMFQNSTKMFYM
ncbi:hypothetical protein HK097_007536 [Rhizophlyctis rosea]|uniref:Piwi domain-containing protein n=1 Tax=Rhizophlyctis rosea TaxID=64517 RepID=A0AAD5SDP5_9FUNG|nr:hypothetical protein HK097_007536 [Rhizophlyctis rosea]